MIRRLAACATALMVAFQPAFAQTEVVVKTAPQDSARFKRVVTLGRAALTGVLVSSATTPRDTAGILVTSVAAGSVADKAGIEEGNRIAAVNGVNLKLHAADAGQADMQGIMQRRFQREMAKVRPGDAVKFTVFSDGRYREVSVQTEAPKALTFHPFMSGADAERASLGAVVGGSATKRDTLGVLVAEIAENGPLAKAGVYEGTRIAAIAGVDLRVPVASAGDAKAGSDKATLLVTELGKLTAGARVEIRVYEAGRFRNVTVTTMKRGEVNMPSGGKGTFFLRGGDNEFEFNQLPQVHERLIPIMEELAPAIERIQRHVIQPSDVDGLRHLRLEGALEGLQLKLQEQLPSIHGWQVINGRRIQASY